MGVLIIDCNPRPFSVLFDPPIQLCHIFYRTTRNFIIRSQNSSLLLSVQTPDLIHNVDRSKASCASGMGLVPAPTKEDAIRGIQPLECAWTNVETDVKSLVPAPMREDAFGIV